MKTAELEGAALDYWVARAEGLKIGCIPDEPDALAVLVRGFVKIIKCKSGIAICTNGTYWPSRRWEDAGPIIEREQIPMSPVVGGTWESEYVCWQGEDDADTKTVRGKTPLIAAMRAFVASKFGDEVEDIPSC